jgi:hypothetical protein
MKPAGGFAQHNMHHGSTIFPYQVLECRQEQETLIECVGLYNMKSL